MDWRKNRDPADTNHSNQCARANAEVR